MVDHPLGKMDYCQTICRSMCNWSNPDDNVFRLHLNNLPELVAATRTQAEKNRKNRKNRKQIKINSIWQMGVLYSFKTYLDFDIAFGAWRSQKFLETIFAIEFALFLDETDVLQWTTACTVHANKMFRTPNFSQCSDEWSSGIMKSEQILISQPFLLLLVI